MFLGGDVADGLAVRDAAFGSGPRALTAPKAEAVLKQYVLKHSPWQSANVELRVVGFSPVALPSGALAYRVLKPNQGITPGTTHFLLALDVAGKEQQRVWIKTEVRVFEEVVVSSTPLAARNLIYPKDVRLDRRDVSSLHADPSNASPTSPANRCRGRSISTKY